MSSEATPKQTYRRRRHFWPLLAGILLGGLLAVSIGPAFSHGRMGRGHGHGHGGMGELDLEQLTNRLELGASFILAEIEATDEQREAVSDVIARVAPRAIALHEEGLALHEALDAELQADTPDLAALEAIRADMVSLADRGSRELLDVYVELANIISPQQRELLRERFGH